MRVRNQKGFTLIELLMVVAVIGIVAALGMPGLLRARVAGNEASAIASLRAISSAQWAYQASCGQGLYAATLGVLGTSPAGGADPFISPDLGVGSSIVKSGYTVAMSGTAATGSSCNGGALVSGYQATANPVSTSSGTRYFATNTIGTVFQSTATILMPETGWPSGATPIQ